MRRREKTRKQRVRSIAVYYGLALLVTALAIAAGEILLRSR